jgi:anti-anti-sigma factor
MSDTNALNPEPITKININDNSKIIYALIAQYPTELHMLFEFSKLEYMNSKAIGYLTDWYGKVTEGKGKIVISNPQANILDILEAVGITELIKCYKSIEEAQTQLFKKEE